MNHLFEELLVEGVIIYLRLLLVTWNYLTNKLSVLDRNTWKHTAVCKLFVRDRNTWYHITMFKNSQETTTPKI